VNDLGAVLDLDAVRAAGSSLGADPLGGAGVAYWGRIAERYGLHMDHLHDRSGPHLPLHAPRLGRQDPHGLLLALRHGRPDRAEGQVRCGLRLRHRSRPARNRDAQRGPAESESLPGGGDLVPVQSPARMEESAGGGQDAGFEQHDRPRGGQPGPPLVEVPVGFKWFVDGLLDGSLGFGGEESAGASFLRRDGTVWTTDKDGIIMGLLAAEILARTGRDPGEIYRR
jgi:phosphoglucomutase